MTKREKQRFTEKATLERDLERDLQRVGGMRSGL